MRPKLKTRAADLEAYVAYDEARKRVVETRGMLKEEAEQPDVDPDKCRAIAERVVEAVAAAGSAKKAWMRRPPARRELAANTHERVCSHLRGALSSTGGCYSGDTSLQALIVPALEIPEAWTETSYGDKYRQSSEFCRTDATHYAKVSATHAAGLYAHPEIVSISDREGLPLLSITPSELPYTYAVTWVRRGRGKQVTTNRGWIASRGGVIFHSAKSPDNAIEGLDFKIRMRDEIELKAAQRRKEKRRTALIARLCRNVTATVEDAKAFGFCIPGIKAFQARYGIGDTATLSELIHTGNQDAANLAMAVALKLQRKPRKYSTCTSPR